MNDYLIKYKFRLIVLCIVLSVVFMLSMVLVSNYNTVVKLEEEINESVGNIEVSQKRRIDLIPNFVDSVKDYKKFEGETLEKIIQARSQSNEGNVDQANKTISMVVENYPELKASDLYKNLQIELSTTENDIANYRRIYNLDVKTYNKKCKSFPTNIIINIMGYDVKEFEFTKYENSSQIPSNLFE